MTSSVIIAEIKGFAQLSTDLARAMDEVAVTPERVRASVIAIVNKIGVDASVQRRPTHSAHIGGDTWYFQFDSTDVALQFACSFLNKCRQLATEQGLFFLKPSIALAIGEPKLSDGRFLDDESIGAYRLADGGKPFNFYIHPNAKAAVGAIAWFKFKQIDGGTSDSDAAIGDWQMSIAPEDGAEPMPRISLPTLLLDSEVIYSRSASEAIDNIVRQQATSKAICAFGGPVPLDVPFYQSYMRDTLASLKQSGGPKFSLVSYIPQNEPATSYTWLELCRRLSIRYSDRFSFCAFQIPDGQLRPFSFQIFDQLTVHLGLRSYSMQSGTPTMSSAIMIRNRNIAERFYGEFVENYRQIGMMDDKRHGEILASLSGLTSALKRECMDRVEALLGSS